MAEQKPAPAAAPRTSSGAAEDARQPRTLEEALTRLELLVATRGQLVVSDGSVDLRLTVDRNMAELEIDGAPLTPATTGAAEKAIVRAFSQTFFWSNVALDLASSRGVTVAEEGVERPRLRVDRTDAGRDVCRAIAEESLRLDPVKKKVPTLRVVVGPLPAARTSKAGDAVTQRLRAALIAKNEISIPDWTRAENVELSDAAVALADLLDANEVKILRKLDVKDSAARPGTSGNGGFVPGLRQERLARSLGREDALAAKAWRRAGWGRLARGRAAEAIEDFTQALSSEVGRAGEPGMEAREGLIAALEFQAEAGRRGGQEPEGTVVVETKRIAGELGRSYLELGLMNRARVALERALDVGSPVPAQIELVGALVGAGQLVRAIERAELLAPKLDRDARRALAVKIVQAGAKGPSLDRALALAGAKNEKRTSAALLAGGVVALLAGGILTVHATAVASLAAASDEVARRLPTEGPTEKLEAPLREVAAKYSYDTAAQAATIRADHIADLAQDNALLEANRPTLRWRSAPDAPAARAALEKLLKGARTAELQGILKTSLAKFDAWATEVRGEVETLQSAIHQQNSSDSQLIATSLDAKYPSWRSLWKGFSIPMAITPTPAEATIQWNGTPLEGGNTVIMVPLEGGAGDLHVEAPGYVAADRRVTLLDAPVLKIVLERKASSTPEPHHTPAPPVTPAPSPRPLPSGVTPVSPPPGKKRIVITIPSPEPEPGDSKSGGDAPVKVAEPEKFTVRDTPESELTRALGTKTIIDPTPGFFDYLKPLVQKRFRLLVEVVTAVRDKHVFIDGVKLHLTDLALGKPIPTKYVELDPPCERPLRGLEGGGWKVEQLTRALHLDAAKLRSDLEEDLNDAQSDFSKREQDSQH